jgi:CheY-like chemotaxis protein
MSTKAPRRSVLVVDDDAAMRDSLREVLQEDQRDVLVAGDGRQALEVLAARDDVGVVLLDVMMPVMNGLEFLAAKLRDQRISGIPVVLMTAHAQDTREVVGVATIFTKPFTTSALLKEVHRLCEDRVRR